MRYHFIGIGGISMSALAAMLHTKGHAVSGSDLTANDQTRKLQAMGVKIHIGHARKNSAGADFVVYNGAVDESNPELGRKSAKLIRREELLAEIESTYKTRIAVAGTHGKSTTAAMIYAILNQACLDPTVHNGAVIQPINSNYVIGKGDIFLTEACEFKRSFLALRPTIAVITNVDFDHADCYKDLADVQAAFDRFAAVAETVVKTQDCPPVDVKLRVPGAHNLENARAAAQVGRVLGIGEPVIMKALENFQGIDRRFQKVAVVGNCDIISDYAHHPTEIATTIQTAKSIYKKFLIIFQPHTYTRTIALFDRFVRVLSTCDCVLYKTYAAREKPIAGGRAEDLAKALNIQCIDTPAALNDLIEKSSREYNAIILTGAGDMQGKFVK
jgi:UDP-N-acetylmuramate--alanine ligase